MVIVIQRAYAHLGVRASIPFWYVDPSISDPLFNLNGLAHKVVFDAEVKVELERVQVLFEPHVGRLIVQFA